MTVEAGGSLQLKALAFDGAGASRDVTETAIWQSSDPKTAVATSTGLVKGGQAGSVDISATVDGVSGRVRIDVTAMLATPRNCAAATLSSYAASFTPFADVIDTTVVTPFPDCRWTAKSDSPWLTGDGATFYDPGRSGDGRIVFNVADNNTLAARVAHLTVTFTDGKTLVFTVTQAAPSCVFVLSPAERSAPYAAISGSFDVQASPSTCSWTAWIDPRISPVWNLRASGGGTGVGSVTYSVNPPANHTRISFPIQIRGANPLDPPAVFWLRLTNQ